MMVHAFGKTWQMLIIKVYKKKKWPQWRKLNILYKLRNKDKKQQNDKQQMFLLNLKTFSYNTQT